MHWNIHSYYSLRYGTLPIAEIIECAQSLGIKTLGLTDINCSTGIFEFVKLCEEAGIKPLAGIEFRNENELLFTLLAKNTKGILEINKLLSDHNIHGLEYKDQLKTLEKTFVIYPFLNFPDKLAEHEYIGIRLSQLNKLVRKDLSKIKSKLILQQPVTFKNAANYQLHGHLRAIDRNLLLSRLEPEDLAGKDELFMSEEALIKACGQFDFIAKNTLQFMEPCEITFDFKSHKNKKIFTTSVYEDKLLLEKLAYEGMERRYGSNNAIAQERVRKELQIIDNLGFSAYFLITWDIVQFSMGKGYYHVGRGSGANSVVAYCLQITDVDPIELNLYFERFLNPKRTSPPDFDIDYSWRERPKVHEYIFKRYGPHHTALLGTMSTFRSSSIYRELGKVYGLPKKEIDMLADFPKKADKNSPILSKIFKIATLIQDFPNHRSIHAGGVLISDEPIYQYSALDLPPVGLPTVQWDMYISEDIGFEKFDILSQRGIGHIKDAADLILQNRGEKVDVHEVEKFKNDPHIRQQLKDANSIGCFYIESPGMRGLLKKLHCDTYIHLVAASSIIRPGVAKSGMMKAYIQRFHEPDKINYLHPVMQEQLEETYGVMVFQEDVLKVCHHFAGLDLADADVLRRAMSGKYRSKAEFQRIVDKFFSNCKEKGYPEALAKEVWRQIESFAGYSFSKAHSASFAVESFQSLFLKTYYPKEFMVAVINNFGGFYRTWVYFNELSKTGVKIHLPSVNHSEVLTNIKGNDVYIGFTHIENLEHQAVQQILIERKAGVYKDLIDFMERTGLSTEQTKILIKVGAFAFTGIGKKNLMWQAYTLQQNEKSKKEVFESNPDEVAKLLVNPDDKKSVQTILFPKPHQDYELPSLTHTQIEDAYDEIELLGFPLSMSDFDLLQTSYRGEVLAKDLEQHLHKKVRMVGNLVTTKPVKTVKGDYMAFGTFYDTETCFFDTTHFAQSLKKYPFGGRGVYLLEGRVVEEFGFHTIEIEKMAKLPTKPDPRY